MKHDLDIFPPPEERTPRAGKGTRPVSPGSATGERGTGTTAGDQIMRHIIRGGRSLAPALLLVTLALAGCSEERGSFMDAGGPIAADQFTHMVRATMLIMIVVLPVLILYR